MWEATKDSTQKPAVKVVIKDADTSINEPF